MRHSASALLLFSILSLTACASPAPMTAESAAPVEEEVAPEQTLTAAGNIPKEIGEVAAILFPGTETNAVAIKVTAITRDPVCPETMFYMPPKNGQFVAIDFEIQTSPDYLTTQPGQYPLSLFWQDWVGYGDDSSIRENSPNGFGCLPEEQMLPMQLMAGETIVGKYVLDLAPDSTSFSWKPSAFSADSVGWEWPIP